MSHYAAFQTPASLCQSTCLGVSSLQRVKARIVLLVILRDFFFSDLGLWGWGGGNQQSVSNLEIFHNFL